MDIKNAFLNGELNEEVYMTIPPGFENEKFKGKVCKLKKSRYGLKRYARTQFDSFTKVLKRQGYCQGQANHTLFVRSSKDDKKTIFLVYVDDIIFIGEDVEEINRLTTMLKAEFEVKDLGILKYFLREIARNQLGIFISQQKYTLDLLKEISMFGCKLTNTLIEPNQKIQEQGKDVPVDKYRYQRLVSKLIYFAHTRPDIAFSVSMVSQYMHSPSEKHMRAVNHILSYLKATPGRWLFFQNNDHKDVEAYINTDWAISVEDKRLTIGYCTKV